MSAPDRSQQQPRMTVSSVGPTPLTTASTSDTFSRAGSALTSTLPRRHSIYGTGEDRIVLDIGSLYIKCGFSGEARPRHIVPVHAGNMRFHWMLDSCGSGGSKKECNEGCRPVGEVSSGAVGWWKRGGEKKLKRVLWIFESVDDCELRLLEFLVELYWIDE